MRGFKWYLILAILFSSSVSNAAVWTVDQSGSGDFETITAALAAANPAGGDVIEIFAGTYDEFLVVDRSVDFVGIGGAGSVVLDGQYAHGLVSIFGAYTVNLRGLTFLNAWVVDAGAAIDMRFGPMVSIEECRFIGNNANFDGGGIHARHGGTRVSVVNSEFTGNRASHNGGAGNVILGAYLEFLDCRFVDNFAGNLSGGIASDTNSTMLVEGCLFLRNRGGVGAILIRESLGYVRQNTLHGNLGALGSIDCAQAIAFVERNIITGNLNGPGLMIEWSPITHGCNILHGSTGDIDGDLLAPDESTADPLYCDLPGEDFTLGLVSPASPDFSACGQLIGAFDPACPMAVRNAPSSMSQLKARF